MSAHLTLLEYFTEYLRRMGENDSYPIDAQEDLEIRRQVMEQTLDLFAGRVDHQFGFPHVREIECKEISKTYIELAISYVDAESVRIFDDGSGAKVNYTPRQLESCGEARNPWVE